ncbi:MAG: hypothetical protein WKF78_14490 [Candidatus Limnocylindrales bacterium]
MVDPDDIPPTPELWQVYGRHVARMLQLGPAFREEHGDAHFIVLSGAPHAALNQAALFGAATERNAAAVAAAIGDGGQPAILAVSATVATDVSTVLERAGLVQAVRPEALFWMAGIPPVKDGPFEVRRAESDADLTTVPSIIETAHGYSSALAGRMYGRDLLTSAGVGCWLAWDGSEPVSWTFVTRVDGTSALFDMMTPPQHRRRGAARNVLTRALADAAARDGGRTESHGLLGHADGSAAVRGARLLGGR